MENKDIYFQKSLFELVIKAKEITSLASTADIMATI